MPPSTPQKILEAALIVFAKNPLATLDQVAEAAGMGRATLFRHFSGKKALMRALSLESHRRCMAALSPLVRGTGGYGGTGGMSETHRGGEKGRTNSVGEANRVEEAGGAENTCHAATSPMQRLTQAVEALIPLGAAFHFLTWEPWHTDDAELEAHYKNYLALWSELLEQVRATGAIARDLPAAWVVGTLDVLLYGAWEGIHNGDIAPKQAAALTLRTFLRGVGPDRSE